MPGVMESERNSLTELLIAWTETLGCKRLLGNYEGHMASVYTGDLRVDVETTGFHEGVLFTFENARSNSENAYRNCGKYRESRCMVGAEFTARFPDGSWMVDEPNPYLWHKQ